MATYTYRLPWPPSVNSYWRRAPRGMYLTKRAREYRKEVSDAIVGAEPGSYWEHTIIAGRIGVHIELTLPDKRKRDIDNHVKGVLDALQHQNVFYDDEQIDDLRVTRLHIEAPGCCDVTITELLTPGGDG